MGQGKSVIFIYMDIKIVSGNLGKKLGSAHDGQCLNDLHLS